jgi:hypothetical protein
MTLLASELGLLPEDIQRVVFDKLKRISRWDALKAKMHSMIVESREKWFDVQEWGDDGYEIPFEERIFHWQRCIKFACCFKMLEMTAVKDEESVTVATYVFNLENRDYEYMGDQAAEGLFEPIEVDGDA